MTLFMRSSVLDWILRPFIVLPTCFVATFLLWLPGLQYPVVSDTLHYADLGRSFWEYGRYAIDGVPYANHLPLQAILSYPFTRALGLDLGMHVTTLLAALGVLTATYALASIVVDRCTAVLTTVLVIIHPAFILMSQLGSADLLFTALSLSAVYAFLRARSSHGWYLVTGGFLGLACLTRYNGLPLLVFVWAWAMAARSTDRRSVFLWMGIGTSIALTSLWFVRNAMVFGSPFHSNYTAELAQEAPNPLWQLLRNIVYYINPIHNIFPALIPFCILGFRQWRHFVFLIGVMFSLWALSMIWWVQAIRFLFPGYPILLLLTAIGMRQAWSWSVRWRHWSLIVLLPLLFLQAFSICLYTYGQCNAWMDRYVGFLPPNMHLTSEGFAAWGVARDFINTQADRGALVFSSRPDVERHHFRSDLVLISDIHSCPLYMVTQKPRNNDAVVFVTAQAPATSVVLTSCP
jgi:4-amino-4-deoxy-L-arabinose transferase-like glycosyltransferase